MKSKRKIPKKAKVASARIVSGYQPERIILFGSHAWGRPRRDSDIDLFVIKKTRSPRIERSVAVQSLLWGSRMPIDVLVYTPAEVKNRIAKGDFFVKNVMTKGTTVYKKP